MALPARGPELALMGRRAATTALVTAVTAAGAFVVTGASAAHATVSRADAFQTRSGDVGCGVTYMPTTSQDRALICSTRGGFLVLRSTGRATLIAWHRPFDPLGGQPPVTLAPGAHWAWRSVRCSLTTTSVTCINGQRQGFTDRERTHETFGAR